MNDTRKEFVLLSKCIFNTTGRKPPWGFQTAQHIHEPSRLPEPPWHLPVGTGSGWDHVKAAWVSGGVWICTALCKNQGFLGGSGGKESAWNPGDPGSIPGSRRSLEKEMAAHSSILAWKIPWTEDPGRLQYKGLQRVGHKWATNTVRIKVTTV